MRKLEHFEQHIEITTNFSLISQKRAMPKISKENNEEKKRCVRVVLGLCVYVRVCDMNASSQIFNAIVAIEQLRASTFLR